MDANLKILFQFERNSGKGGEENSLWTAYCAFHLGEYKQAMEVAT